MKNSVKNTAANMVSNSNVNKAFMAFGKGVEMKEFTPTPKYEGFGVFEVLGVNLSQKELQDLGFHQEKEPVYTFGEEDKAGFKLEFVIKSDAEKCGVELLSKITFRVFGTRRTNRDGSKMQVIDKYGNTAWVTQDEFFAKATVLEGKNGKYQSNIDSDYRGIFSGEEAVTNFIKIYLQIPNNKAYANGTWIDNKDVNPDDCLCAFSEQDIKDMLAGKFNAIKDAIAGCPLNRVKLLAGVQKVTDEETGKTRTYQQFYTNKVAYAFSKKNLEENFAKELVGAGYELENGKYTKNDNTFCLCDIREVSVASTNFEESKPAAAPASKSWGFGE